MAAAHSPDRVTFLFVDYKGGSAFADCVELPHCVGLVTDLSPHLVRRALTSLRAELHHREHLLQPQEGQGPARAREAAGSGVPARPRARDRRVRRAGQRGAGVRRRRRRHRAARPLARHPPDHGHPAPGRRHQGQPARQHQPAHRPAHGRRVRLADVVDDPVRGDASRRQPAGPRRSPRPDPGGWCRSSRPTRAAGRTEEVPPRPRCGSAELRFGSSARVGARPAGRADAHDEDLGPERPEAHRRRRSSARPTRRGCRRPRRPWLDDLATARRPARPAERGRRAHPPRRWPTCPRSSCSRPRRTSCPTATARWSSTARRARASPRVLKTIAHRGRHAARPRHVRGLRPRLRLGCAGRPRAAAARRLDHRRRRRRAHPAAAAHARRRAGPPRGRVRRGQRRQPQEYRELAGPARCRASCC